jgi:hypothetical protein
MSQHFLLSAKARTLSLASVLRMTDAEAETMFRNIRCIHPVNAAASGLPDLRVSTRLF